MIAFALITTEFGNEINVLKEVNLVPDIKYAKICHGVYDIIARIESETKQNLYDVVRQKINNIKNVKSVQILICAPS